MPHWVVILILFALGACVGSFLNVVVYRLPRVVIPAGATLATEAWLTLRGLSTPPSHCPRCDTRLGWRDNIPIFGWLFLGGRCRYCREPISIRYPTVEFVTGLLFAGTYVLMFIFDLGPCAPTATVANRFGFDTVVPGGLNFGRDGWLLALYCSMLACLLAASLIDAELYIIPLWIPWLMTLIGFVGHAVGSATGNGTVLPGNLIPESGTITLMTIGGGVGLVISLLAVRFGLLRRSFAEGDPLTKNEQDAIAAGTLRVEDIPMPVKDYTPREVRREIRYEIFFLLPLLLLAGLGGWLALKWQPAADQAEAIRLVPVLNGFLGSLFGAMIGAGWVWVTRILGSIGFGREAMGMGDVHLMFGVGAILGAGMTSVAFFLAPLPGLLIHVWLIFVDPKRAVPFGPYLSMGAAIAIFVYCPISGWLGGGVAGLGALIRSALGRMKGDRMRTFFEAVWWWIRLTVLLIVAVYVISILALNARETPSLWYWYGRDPSPVSIVSIVLVSFLSGGVVFTTGWAMFKAGLRYRRTRSARRERLEQERRAEIERKARMLRTKPPPTPIVRRPTPVAPMVAEPEPPAEAEPESPEVKRRFDVEEMPAEADRRDEGPIPLTDERVASASPDDAVAGVRLPPPPPPPAGS